MKRFTQVAFIVAYCSTYFCCGTTGAQSETNGTKSEAFSPPTKLSRIRVSEDGSHFVTGRGDKFVVWGVNYDHDTGGRLLDEYWNEDWSAVVEDFREIKQLGANCVRIHLQVGMFMESPEQPRLTAFEHLSTLLSLAEETGLYLDITGLACYHQQSIPAWYDALDEGQRWKVQARFWEEVAKTCCNSPVVFCYDLMNEPILPGKDVEAEWLTGELGGKFFVQRLSLDAKGRSRQEIAAAWVRDMVGAIRRHDKNHMITVGVIPWIFVFGGGQPLFYSPEVGGPLDFVSVHFYPQAGKVDEAVAALEKYEIGKPLIVEEMFPLKCSVEELEEFVRRSAKYSDGWISFYWGTPAQELLSKKEPSIAEAITASWLTRFQSLSSSAKSGQLGP